MQQSPSKCTPQELSSVMRSFGLAGLLFCVWSTFVLIDSMQAEERSSDNFQCRWADEKITVDGKADEKNWQNAQLIDNFYLPWLQDEARPAKTATKARLLWDREYFYFFAEMEDGDLYANIKEHDGRLWENDVFELFLKPAADKPGYYEFQLNPAGAVLDMFIPRRGSGEYTRYHSDGPFHVDAKVALDGTLNKWSDSDKGWSVEGRIPWGDFLRTGGRPAVGEVWKFALCRYDYSVDFEGPELSTCAPLKSKTRPDFHHWEDYAPLKFVGPNAQQAARPFGINDFVPLTTSRVVGSPDPPLPYVTQRAYPKLQLKFPIFAITQPGSGQMIFIDQDRPYAKTRICRTKNDISSGEFDVLLELDDTAYSIAFHPDFADNGFVFVGSNGTDEKSPKGKSTRITRYTMERKPPHRLPADSGKVIIAWPSDGHNGGAITFGKDGMLYITSGDGTSDSDVDLKGQGLDHLLAKTLRIDVDREANGKPYAIPKDNPFVGKKDVAPETWAYGFRNPWRITTDEKTGDIWVGNNGQDLWEQVYLVERGANYGWSVYEGSHPFYLNRNLGPTPVRKPAAEHHHVESRSLTGGVVYYGKKLPKLHGMYIYGDYSTGKVWAIRHEDGEVTKPIELVDTPFKISGFAIDPQGELLVIDHTSPDGGFYHLVPKSKDVASSYFPRKLSESGLFLNVAKHQVQPALIPYSVNSPLWSDGAYKERYIALPGENPKINFHPTKSWGFPEGTVLVKSFALETVESDPQSRRWIETRFLTKQQGEWVGYTYAWNEQQTNAELVESQGRDLQLSVRTKTGMRQQTWHIPGRAECMVCHSRAANFVLGVSTAQLNKDHHYGEVVDNQLRTLESLGLFQLDPRKDAESHFQKLLIDSGMTKEEAGQDLQDVKATRNQRTAVASCSLLAKSPDAYDQLADPYDADADLNARARSYLHVNCASCHINAGGGNAQINLAYHRQLSEMEAVGKPPLHDKYSLPEAQIIHPGHPRRSVLLHRMRIRGRGQMPPLATHNVDERAVELIRQWIAKLEPPADKESK